MTCGNIVTQSPLWGYIKQAFKRVGGWCQLVLHLIHDDLFATLTPWRRAGEWASLAVSYLLLGWLYWSLHAPQVIGIVTAVVLTVGAVVTWAWLGYRVHRRVCVRQDSGVAIMYSEPVQTFGICGREDEELVIRSGEYELTLYPFEQGMVLCEKGGRVCIEHIQDEHIFRFLYDVLTDYASSEDEAGVFGPVSGEREVAE